MCGILGFSRGKDNSVLTRDRVIALVSILITHMDERGGDSFGYVADGEIVKDVGTAAAGVHLEKIANAQTLIMHTRKATVGDVTAENSHPFRKGSIIGVHNGGVSNWQDLNKDLERDFKVDSEHIFAHLAENRSLLELRAGGAIAFVEEEDLEMVSLCKFNGGSLTIMGIGETGENTTDVVFASTAAPLLSALHMAKVGEFFPFRMPEDDLFYAKGGKLFLHTPNIQLLFGSRYVQHINTHRRRDYTVLDNRRNIVRPPWGMNGVDYEDNSVVGDTDKADAEAAANDTALVNPMSRFYASTLRKTSEQGIATKHFLATRKKALEGYYGENLCGLCKFMTANVKCTLTNLLYCINCWKYVEQISPFIEDSYQKLVSDVIQRDRKKVDEVPNICERCLSDDPERKVRWFDTMQELAICGQCSADHHYTSARLVLMTGLGMAKLGQCCEICDDDVPKRGVMAEIKYVSFTEKRELWVCFTCFKGEIEVDAATKARQMIELARGEKNVTPLGSKTSARNPLAITRPSPKVVEVNLPADSNVWSENDPSDSSIKAIEDKGLVVEAGLG